MVKFYPQHLHHACHFTVNNDAGESGNHANLLEDIRTSKKNLTLSSETITTAHAAFTIHYNSFLILAEKLESEFKELEVREEAIEKKEKDIKVQEEQLQQREKKCTEKEQNVMVREGAVSTKEEKWVATEKRMQENSSKLPSVIQFNVGGKRFAASKEKLLQSKGSLFEQMITSDHSQQLPSGKIFIERDPKYFSYIIRFLVDGILPCLPNAGEGLAIEKEFAYFHIPLKSSALAFSPRIATLKNELVDDTKHGDKLKEWIPLRRFQLIYKATVDGFAAADFHKCCDNKGPTLTVIRSSNGHLFGGYSVLPWDSTKNYKNHAEGFIFTLTNPHNIPPTKYSRNLNRQEAIYCNSSYGPTFGCGYDIYVTDNSHQNNTSDTNFDGNYGYIDTTGKGMNTFTGARHFTTNEIEVFVVL